MEAEDFVDQACYLAVPVFRHVACNGLGQVVIFKNPVDQIL